MSRIETDDQIKEEVHALAGFKTHVTAYVIVIVLFGSGWFAGGGNLYNQTWPLYLAAGWGLVILVHFIFAYRAFRKRKRTTPF